MVRGAGLCVFVAIVGLASGCVGNEAGGGTDGLPADGVAPDRGPGDRGVVDDRGAVDTGNEAGGGWFADATVVGADAGGAGGCPPEAPVRDGDWIINGEADVLATACFTIITGRLLVVGTALGSLELPTLVSVEGDVQIEDNARLTRVSLPTLSRVGADRDGGQATLSLQRNAALVDLDLPALALVNNDVLLSDNAAIATIRLAALETIGRDSVSTLSINGNGALVAIDLPRLTRLVYGTMGLSGDSLESINLPALVDVWSWLEVAGCPRLTALSLPSLTHAVLGLRLNPSLTTVDLPSLTTVGMLDLSRDAMRGELVLPALQELPALTVSENPGLTAIRLPALPSLKALTVQSNATLATLDMPLLASISEALLVNDNPALCQSVVDTLQAAATGECTVEASGNLYGC